MLKQFTKEHDRRAKIIHAIVDLMEVLEIPQDELIRLSDEIQRVEFENRKET